MDLSPGMILFRISAPTRSRIPGAEVGSASAREDADADAVITIIPAGSSFTSRPAA
jgi:hypothetical protein